MFKTLSIALVIIFASVVPAQLAGAQISGFEKGGQTRPQISHPPKPATGLTTLPGVKPARPIVGIAKPEPMDDHSPDDPQGGFMINNTRVKISGSVIVDIGTDASRHK
ncbi:hypothetical protein [Pseudochrobactrum sp. HB0163]|uniref:hypothetical protein n=1 Tax=Pseudochrobactrum sp. HB0163 TaxID=3450708 RepID=UPI003F6E037F